MLSWRNAGQNEEGVLGCFFVKKRDGSLRIIFDTRLFGLDFRDPAP